MKSYFLFTNKQRNGIFLLIIIILLLQILIFSSSRISPNKTSEDLSYYESQIDSLRLIKVNENQKNKNKVYKFNPNFITDYKGYTLGMSPAEIDKLHNFRAENKWVNNALEFQKVTGVSDSLLKSISPLFKFPSWVNKTNQKSKSSKTFTFKNTLSKTTKIDLNKANKQQLQKVYGIGDKLSDRIIKQRESYNGGFYSLIELKDVWGLSDEVIEELKLYFEVKTPRDITKYNINTANRDQLVLIPHIDYEVANNIIEYRQLNEGFISLKELTKVQDIPLKKIPIIKLYLSL